ncbi:DUF4240 domain-containing protein [Nonomuraea sp. NPDC050310]|uniref:DUF4240 domain-containing protein n=1 Tax=unclassified Nonomuraea TaxID=2593643 RepID=UPI0033D3F7D3
MDIDGFWDLVERSDRESGSRAERLAWLDAHLRTLPVEEILDYQVWMNLAERRIHVWDMYGMYWHLYGFGSGDGFLYFVRWLISLGRDAFEFAAESPDRIAELPQVLHSLTDEDCRTQEFERFGYVAQKAYDVVSASGIDSMPDALTVRAAELGVVSDWNSFGDGEHWDFEDEAEVERHLPGLIEYRARLEGTTPS